VAAARAAGRRYVCSIARGSPPDRWPPITDLVRDPPASWQGLPVSWTSEFPPSPVFVAQFTIAPERDVWLFRASYSLTEALVDGDELGGGYFVEYFVADEDAAQTWAVHRLLQRESVTYAESDERDDYVAAADVGNQGALSIHGPPAWVAADPIWPTQAGNPMQFVGQRAVDEGAFELYLFWVRAGAGNVFKIVEQERGAQSAESHYEDEESAWRS
jgi:hypothetical protein